MVVVMFPRLAALKVESSWGHGRKSMVRCIAHLTRALTANETDRLRELVPVEEIQGDRVAWFCRPAEVEQVQERVALALTLLTRSADRRSKMRMARSGDPYLAG